MCIGQGDSPVRAEAIQRIGFGGCKCLGHSSYCFASRLQPQRRWLRAAAAPGGAAFPRGCSQPAAGDQSLRQNTLRVMRPSDRSMPT